MTSPEDTPWQWQVGIGIAALLCFLVGCEEPNFGSISGTVTVDGKPVAEGSIAFLPVNQDSFTAGAVIEEGWYASHKVPLGELRVEIRVPKKVGEQKLYDVPDSPVMPLLEEALPARYNNRSELRIQVVAGPNEHNFELSSQ